MFLRQIKNQSSLIFDFRMDSMNVKRDDGLVSFATLFGMCDYITFPLGKIFFVDIFVFHYVNIAAVGYDAYKLTPYGPIRRLLPYLTRRAQENRAIFAKAEKDRRLYYQALKQRL